MSQSGQNTLTNSVRYEALTTEVTASELREYRNERSVRWVFVARIGSRIVLAFFAVAGIIAFIEGIISGDVTQAVVSMIVTALGVCAWSGWLLMARQADTAAIKMSKFAVDNGWLYERGPVSVDHQGLIFQQGHSRRAGNVIVSANGSLDGLLFEMGDYQYTTGSGKNRQVHYWTYCCVELDRHVPHMVLDATSNNVSFFGKNIMSNLPMTFRKDQQLSLEGDFNKYFTLYAPRDYEQDAYYIFTPDLMALLIDTSQGFDAEVIDNKIYFYSPRTGTQTPLSKPEPVRTLMNIIATVGASMYRRTDYYADDKIANRSVDVVANGGRRLRHGVSWVLIFIVLLIAVVNIMIVILG